MAIVAGQGQAGSPSDRLEQLAEVADTLVVLMPVARLEDMAARVAAVRGGDCPAILVASATRPGQRVLHTQLGEVAAQARQTGVQAPATLILGEV